jgi:hypothetical protein
MPEKLVGSDEQRIKKLESSRKKWRLAFWIVVVVLILAAWRVNEFILTDGLVDGKRESYIKGLEQELEELKQANPEPQP